MKYPCFVETEVKFRGSVEKQSYPTWIIVSDLINQERFYFFLIFCMVTAVDIQSCDSYFKQCRGATVDTFHLTHERESNSTQLPVLYHDYFMNLISTESIFILFLHIFFQSTQSLYFRGEGEKVDIYSLQL